MDRTDGLVRWMDRMDGWDGWGGQVGWMDRMYVLEHNEKLVLLTAPGPRDVGNTRPLCSSQPQKLVLVRATPGPPGISLISLVFRELAAYFVLR